MHSNNLFLSPYCQIALLDQSGSIVSLNTNNRSQNLIPDLLESFSKGENYVRICENSPHRFSGKALLLAEGIREVLSGEKTGYALEYGESDRWFEVSVICGMILP